MKRNRSLTFWLAMLVMMTCVVLLSLSIIPFALTGLTVPLFTIILTFGLICGFFINALFRDVKEVPKHHKHTSLVIILFLSVLMMVLTVNVSNILGSNLGLNIFVEPWKVGAAFGFFLVLPLLLKIKRSQLLQFTIFN
jgi:hypothetical protein